jgi:transcriptional regulator with XRE-family HTH domain
MALSQNVVINFLTKFDKKGLQKATKELKGFDKFIASSKFATKAALVTAGLASAYALDRLAKSSVRAALEQERLDKSVEQSLSSINELGSVAAVKTLITDLQTATNITEDELTPALNGLIISTGNLGKAQNLLSVAIDTSKGSGVDLLTVTDALGKANRGQFRSLGQLGLGFNAVTAEEMGLAEITDYLILKFGGAAKRATETFGSKLDDLKISAGEAQENLGQGFITAAEIIIGSSNATDVFGAKLELLGLNGGYILIALADKVNKIQESFSGLSKSIEKDPILKFFFGSAKSIPVLGGWIDGFRGLAKDGKKIADTSKEVVVQTEEQKAAAAKLAALQAKFDKFAAAALDKSKKLTKEKAAQAALDKKKAELESMFDIDKINLQAALSRKLSGEDELRVKILQKLADGTKAAVDEALKYADVLKVIEDGKITTAEVEMLAKKWGMTTVEVLIYLQQLFLANEELRKMLGLLDEISKKKMPSPAGASMFDPGYFTNLGQQLVGTLGYTGMSAADISAERYKESGAARRGIPFMAEGGIVSKPTIAMIGEAGAEAVIPLDRMGSMGTKVVVNVQGSVISEGQLQSVIQDVLYNLNRTGAVTQLANLGR